MNSLVRIACIFGILRVLDVNGVDYTNPQYLLVCFLLLILMLMQYIRALED